MKNWLKHLFIPHEHNDYKPHFFREYSIAVFSIIGLFLLSLSFGSFNYFKNTEMTAAVLPSVLVDLTNRDRADNNKAPLARSIVLDQAALMKAEDMANNNYFAHTSPTGVTPWHWFSKVKYNFVYAGENLAVDFTESTDVETAWLNSPKHRQNIMDDRFTEIGIAAKEGILDGRPTIFVVEMFGKPIESNPVLEIAATNDTKKIESSVKVVEEKTSAKEIAISEEPKPAVLGEEVDAVLPALKVMDDTKEFTSVENTLAPVDEKVATKNTAVGNTNYSNKADQILFNSPKYVSTIYQIIMGIVLLALLMMISIEIKRQHPKNIAYGVGLMALMIILSYVNKTLFF